MRGMGLDVEEEEEEEVLEEVVLEEVEEVRDLVDIVMSGMCFGVLSKGSFGSVEEVVIIVSVFLCKNWSSSKKKKIKF